MGLDPQGIHGGVGFLIPEASSAGIVLRPLWSFWEISRASVCVSRATKTWVSYTKESDFDGLPISGCTLLSVESLEICSGPISQLLPWFLTNPSIEKLKTVSFGCIVDGAEARAVKEFLARLGSSLLHLSLEFRVVYGEHQRESKYCDLAREM